jgi:hypothetical protein
MGESPWRDICGYSLLALQRTEAGLDAEKKQLLNLLQQKVDKKDGVKK